ncbi:MAG: helix-turn-helix domain-containing protein [Alphaproteobacteria bacterium]|jgi:transcriptional regulator with XRE-family HTH domain|uniref:Helix-turn-helix domain-containing protein n=1 Tax=Brevundimonas aurifodinae TaxID=1508312 RepID=A0ABV1NK86_9CAUL|nr:helix-turn-helix domain-containing protein [Alphaproteobacteria bacterium]MBU2040847.1 helix-turn-helix domain-containing protein [Alphaproteobacteria bacterium]MBU2127313.1 helix-turn-helix domain-containing protein [Alphaproteobacteria bacterium]MBU2207729.1 helix-turn-helix domain-containing protein [Alphaproteobacteria bacterium]MBU2291071.1 helix-turn-helix domain-containing protein [Alphaproteobacteria bacterium]
MKLAQIFGKNVRRVRAEKGMTIEGLANEVGLSYSYVGELQRGKRNPTLKVVERIAGALGVRAVDLLRE